MTEGRGAALWSPQRRGVGSPDLSRAQEAGQPPRARSAVTQNTAPRHLPVARGMAHKTSTALASHCAPRGTHQPSALPPHRRSKGHLAHSAPLPPVLAPHAASPREYPGRLYSSTAPAGGGGRMPGLDSLPKGSTDSPSPIKRPGQTTRALDRTWGAAWGGREIGRDWRAQGMTGVGGGLPENSRSGSQSSSKPWCPR